MLIQLKINRIDMLVFFLITTNFLMITDKNDIVTPRLQYVNDSCIIIRNCKIHLNFFWLQSNLIYPS